ncbi:hypothetical protein [Escherichia coli]|uniref:hypothetical protein n=1 Tax=Escherichia coli TaxID=562 RepID=UPI00164FEDA8|nr:hypothetical protein [Escherichia coli]
MTVRETEENIEQIFPELSNLIDIINKWLSHGNIDPRVGSLAAAACHGLELPL